MQEDGLREIDILSDRDVEFLAAAGVEKISSLAGSDASMLHDEMVGANAILSIGEAVPSAAKIEDWIKAAREIGGFEESEDVSRLPVTSLEDELQILVAIPVSPRVLIEQKILVQDVPPMEIIIEDDSEPRSAQVARRVEKAGAKSVTVREVSLPVGRKNDESSESASKVLPLEKSPVRDIRKTASAEVNAGKKLHSRRFIRGVLHPQPIRVRIAAFITLITLLLLPATFVAGALMMAHFPLWLAVIPAAFLFSGILYILYARGMKCRICGQPLFAPKACHRHVKVHRLPLVGYILPTCIHILLFHWFRCMYCGTSIRIKE